MKDTIVAYKRLFDSDDGEKVIKDLMRSCHMITTTFDPNPQQQAYNEGARSVVLRIINTINLSEDKLASFMKQMEEQDEYTI